MTAHVQLHDGLNRMAVAVATRESRGVDGSSRPEQDSLIARALLTLRRFAAGAYAAMVASREARAFEEIARYDWRLAAEVRAAAMRDRGTPGA